MPFISLPYPTPTHPQTYDDEFCFVSRAAVFSDEGKVAGAVSQVQFVEKTAKLSSDMKALNEQLEFYQDELHRLSVEYY